MIVQTRENKDLVIPKSLGNFVTEGSGGGISPEEAAEIASAITAEAIDEYDTEIQVDLEDIRDAVSGNSEDISELSGATMAIEQSLGDYATTAETQAIRDDLADYATTADTATLEEQIEGKEDKPFVLELSTLDDAELTNEDKANIDALFAYLSGKTIDEINAVLINPDNPETLYKLTYTDGVGTADFNAVWSWGGEQITVLFGQDGYSVSVDSWEVPEYQGGDGIDITDNTVSLKIAKGMYFDQNGRLSIGLGSGLTLQSSTELALDVGEGLGFSGRTLVVSGASGGGIEKVSVLPQDAEEGDVVFLEGHTETGYTITMDMSEKSWESGYLVAYINGNNTEYYCGGGDDYGVWRYDEGYQITVRNRRDGNHRYFDFITATAVTLGSDADSLQSEVEYPFLGKFYVYRGGEWNIFANNVYVDFDNAPETAKAAFIEIYSGLTDFDGSNLIILHNQDNNASYEFEFKPYNPKYYGLDCQAADSRGSSDGRWGQIRVDANRLSYDWENDTISFGTLVGTKWSATEEQIPSVPSISFTRFGNDEKGYLTYDADNGYFLYDNGTLATGVTSAYSQDIVDYLFTDALRSGGLIFGSIFPVNQNNLYVIQNGETKVYCHPALSFRDLASPVTIDDTEFSKEVSYKYADWELTMWYAEDNKGANIRIYPIPIRISGVSFGGNLENYYPLAAAVCADDWWHYDGNYPYNLPYSIFEGGFDSVYYGWWLKWNARCWNQGEIIPSGTTFYINDRVGVGMYNSIAEFQVYDSGQDDWVDALTLGEWVGDISIDGSTVTLSPGSTTGTTYADITAKASDAPQNEFPFSVTLKADLKLKNFTTALAMDSTNDKLGWIFYNGNSSKHYHI